MERVVKISIVCEWNEVRSPAAEIMLAQEWASASRPFGLNITTAGIFPENRIGGSGYMSDALDQLGYLRIAPSHVPCAIDPTALPNQQLILAVDKRTKSAIQRMVAVGTLGDRLYTIPGYAGYPGREIVDPNNLRRDTLYSRLVRNISSDRLRQILYGLGGYIYPNDYLLVPDVYLKTAKEIQFYIPKVAKRIQQQFCT